MALGVGTHDNVVFNVKANEVNGQPVLNVLLTQQGAAVDPFDFETASVDGGGEDVTSITAWALKKKGYENGALVEERSPSAIMSDYKDGVAFRSQVLQLMGVNLDNVKWDPFENLDTTGDAVRSNTKLLQDDDLLAQMTKNLNEQTVRFAKEAKQENGDVLNRVTLVRTSKKNHNPKLRDKYLNSTPMGESMDVAADKSKVGFTAGEKKAGLDSGLPLESDEVSGTQGFDSTFGTPQIKDPSGVPAGL